MLIESPGARSYLLNALEAAPELLDYLLDALSTSETDFRPDPARFTIREVVAHLADWDEIFLRRLLRTRDEPEPALEDVDETVLAHDYARANPQAQAQLLRERRHRLVELARSLEDSHWQRIALHPRLGRTTLEGLVAVIPLHDTYHLRQVAQWRTLYAARAK